MRFIFREMCFSIQASGIQVKMLLRCLLLTSSFVTLSWTYECPQPNVCTCEGIILNCTCKNLENINIITPPYEFDIRHVLIKRCGTVVIRMGSLTIFQLDSIEIDDLERLTVHPFALSNFKSLGSLRISNVRHMEISPRGFSTLSNTGTISLSNVSWDEVPVESFGGLYHTENFIITDSSFGTVKSLAFVFNNLTKFSVKNSFFGKAEAMSLMVRDATSLSFEDCKFQNFSYAAFSLEFVEKLSFQKCAFNVISTSAIFASNLGSFALNNCTINNLEDGAFENIADVQQIRFSDNVVNLAEKNSLFFGTDDFKNVETDIRGNMFTCDSNLTWLWENVINSSFCIDGTDTVSTTYTDAVSTTYTDAISNTYTDAASTTYTETNTLSKSDSPTQKAMVHQTGAKLYPVSFLVGYLCAVSLWEVFFYS